MDEKNREKRYKAMNLMIKNSGAGSAELVLSDENYIVRVGDNGRAYLIVRSPKGPPNPEEWDLAEAKVLPPQERKSWIHNSGVKPTPLNKRSLG